MTDLSCRAHSLSKYLAGVLFVSSAVVSHAEIVYSNFQTPLDYYAGAFGKYDEIADDIFLGGKSRVFKSVSIAYSAFDVPKDATLTLTIYDMNGPSTPKTQEVPAPGAALFQRTTCLVNGDSWQVTFTDPSGSIYLPEHIAVGLSFTGIGYGEENEPDAGPLLLNPPTIGSSFDDFWIRGLTGTGPDWGLYDLSDAEENQIPANFAIRINAVPDGGVSWSVLSIPAVLLFGRLTKRFGRNSA